MMMMSQVMEVHKERGDCKGDCYGCREWVVWRFVCASSALAGSAGGASGPTAASSAGGASKMGSFLTRQVMEKHSTHASP